MAAYNQMLTNRYVRRDGGTWNMINNDFLNVQIKSNSVQAIVTSPPYNIGIQYDGYNDKKPLKEYLSFMLQVFSKCYDVLAPTGRIMLNVPLATTIGDPIPIHSHIMSLVEQAGFTYKNTIVWNNKNASNRFAFGSYCSASAPNVIGTEELIIVYHKGAWKRSTKGESTIRPIEFMKFSLSPWEFNGETKKGKHPVPFPFELPYRLIQYFTFVGDTILDPFAGRGTTLAAAASLGRHGVGVEISKEYCDYAKEYIEGNQHKKAA